MYSIDQKQEEEKKVVEVVPLGKWKRILVFFADFFICFLAAFVFLNAMTMPIGQAITGFSAKQKKSSESMSMMHTILYKNGVVLAYKGNDDDDIDSNILYTFDCWLSYYVLDEAESPDTTHPQYGHKEANKVIYHYFNDLRDNHDQYISLFDHYNETNHYFTLSGTDYVLNDLTKSKLIPYFDPKVELGSEVKTLVKAIKSNAFLPLLAEVFTDIKTNDLTYNSQSYNECETIVKNFSQYLRYLVAITILIAYFLAVVILFLIIPLINKNRKTISMMMMHIERINISRLYVCKRSESVSNSLFALLSNAGFLFTLPISFVTFSFVFNLNVIVIFTLLAALLCLVSFIFILFNPFNRALSDIFSRSVMITTDKLDEIYRAKGYNV